MNDYLMLVVERDARRMIVLFSAVVAFVVLASFVGLKAFEKYTEPDSRSQSQPLYCYDGSGNGVTVTASRGGFVAFHKNARTESYPRLAISADGLQIKTKSGKLVFVDLEELAALNK